jgi:mono/diheme cytochrome c family protein
MNMSLNCAIGESVVRVIATCATLALMSFMDATPAQAQALSKASPWVAPERASNRANPLPPTPDAITRGQDLFKRDCVSCHGKAGHGDGPMAASVQPRPSNLASQQVQSQSDGALFWKITQGRGMMPKATLKDNDKWAVINYLRTLSEGR